jgi:rhodanese-related sulfurtransferase
MSQIDPQRKKVVVLCAAVACMAAAAAALKGRPMLVGGVIALQVVTLVYAMVEFAKLKRQGK